MPDTDDDKYAPKRNWLSLFGFVIFIKFYFTSELTFVALHRKQKSTQSSPTSTTVKRVLIALGVVAIVLTLMMLSFSIEVPAENVNMYVFFFFFFFLMN